MNGEFFLSLGARWFIVTAILWLGLVPMAWGQTFLVNSVGDEPLATTGSISCVSTAGTCTLRAAIQANNNRTTTNVTLSFASIPVPPGGDGINDGVSSRIILNSALPTITRQITLLGETHPNFDAGTGFQRVQIDGGNVTTNSSGLFISGSAASGTVIRNVAIRDAANHGISVSNADNVVIQENRLGLYNLLSLDVPAGNGNYGLNFNNSSGSVALDNRIASNDSGGIRVAGSGSSNLLIAGNVIGAQLQPNGSLMPRGNGGPGINILSTAGSGSEIGRCVLGFGISDFCRGNLIVSNEGHGINIAAAGQSVVFNSIGFNGDSPGNSGFGNSGDGIRVAASDTFIGGGLAGQLNTANTIGYSGGDGINVEGGSNVTIAQNRIGGHPDGTAFGNSGVGIWIRGAASVDHSISNNFIAKNQIGIRSDSGPTDIIGNTIQDNGSHGIFVRDPRQSIEDNTVGLHTLIGIFLFYLYEDNEFATVYRNWVGTAPDGTPLGNANGIVVDTGQAVIGQNQGDGNIIAGNSGNGLVLTGARDVVVRANFIGQLPDGTPRGNGQAGVLIQPVPGFFDATDSRTGYLRDATIPSLHFPSESGGFGQGNLIAHNRIGVQVTGGDDTVGHLVRGNSIFANQDGGIQIFPIIGSVNEGPGEGPNRGLNHPQLDDNATFFDADSGTVEYRVRVPTSASEAGYPLRLDFYITEPGEAQGKFFIGTAQYPAASADSWVSGSFTPIGDHSLGDALIVAMASDTGNNSSEFSAAPADLSQGSPSPLDNIVISSFGDAPNADPNGLSCDTGGIFIAPGVPNCTLRAAIQAANNHTEPVTITFWPGLVAPGGVSTFAPQSQLPAITGQVTLAGDSHASFDPANGPAVVISGQNQSQSAALFRVSNANNVELRHLAFVDSPREGLSISNSQNVTVRNSLFGLRPSTGAFVAAGNGTNGLQIGGSSGLEILDNWIAANTQRGVQFSSGGAGSRMIGNIIGAGRDGSGNLVPLGNDVGIIVLSGAGSGLKIGECTGVPFLVQCPGNIVVASETNGLTILGDGVSMAGNWVGVDPDAPLDSSFGNQGNGVLLGGSGHLMTGGLGGAVIGDGSNIIGHSGVDGLVFSGESHGAVSVFSGVTPSGDVISNARYGILVESGSGHLVSSARVAHNVRGIVLDSSGNIVRNGRVFDNEVHGIQINQGGQLIEGNVIGNHGQAGIIYGHPLDSSADGLVNIVRNRIGVDVEGQPMPNQFGLYGFAGGRAWIGNDDEDGNIIAFNEQAGVVLISGTGARIRSNWIGMLPDGTAAGNGSVGVLITTPAAGGTAIENEVGYSAVADIPPDHADGSVGAFGNVIAHHERGIVVNAGSESATVERNSLRGNRFVANQVAVQLGDSPGGIDPGGSQTGPNRLQNPPEFDAGETQFDDSTGVLSFRFRVDTLFGNANYPLRVDFYLVESGQPGRFLYTQSYLASSATQFVSGSFTPAAGLVNSGNQIVGMATDLAGNSSEFSVPVNLGGEQGDSIFADRFEED